ncbi:MAG: TetR/AcrR family transcriptional regulator [Limnochordales bacterium]|nr:TetR/AcrR family transcriptional regulator [Limnochordales bacterium]
MAGRGQGRYEELLETALRLFREKGYRTTSMQDIADALGLRKASLYHYIRSKEDLLVPAYQYTIDAHVRRLEEIAQGSGSARERLRQAIASHLAAIIQHADLFALYLREVESLPEHLRQAVRAANRAYRVRLTDLIRQGVEAGEFKAVDPAVAALLILGACNWLSQWYAATGRMSPQEITELFLEVLLNGLSK